MHHVIIYWKTNDIEKRERIRKRFSLQNYTSVNGETPACISDEDMPVLLETESRGFIQIRRK